MRLNFLKQGYYEKQLIIIASLTSFVTYLSMYGLRKPFVALQYESLSIFNIDYKIVLIILQLLGYTASKIYGISFFSNLHPNQRSKSFFACILIAWLSLFLFGIIPYPYNSIFMFFNGFPLGLIWGILFSYLEGRRSTELLGAIMASSFIVSSGLVKSIALLVHANFHISNFMIPFITSCLFIPFLFIGFYIINKMPLPTEDDKINRTERLPLDAKTRNNFYHYFSKEIISLLCIYIGLTIFRDLRDNFAVDFWKDLDAENVSSLVVFTEIPIAALSLLFIASTIKVKNNKLVFYGGLYTMIASGILLVVTTIFFKAHFITPWVWMSLSGFAIYLPYMTFHTLLFERWLAHFKLSMNVGFLMYTMDSMGYLSSSALLLIKNFYTPKISWSLFLETSSLYIGVLLIIGSSLAIYYFKKKEFNPIKWTTSIQ